MKLRYFAFLICLMTTFQGYSQTTANRKNPFLVEKNTVVDYAKVTPADVDDYAKHTLNAVKEMITRIKKEPTISFDNVFGSMDEIKNKIYTTSNNCFMMYWVSTDSITRAKGLAGYQLLDSLSTSMYSDKDIYNKMLKFKASPDYGKLKENRKILVDDMILGFELSGVNLSEDKLSQYKTLSKEINELSTNYSNNMNSAKDILTLDNKGAEGLPEDFKANYKVGDHYEIPIINATNETVMGTASNEETRKAYYTKFFNRAADKNIDILDQMVKKRDELAKVMGYPTYASYATVTRMAKNPQTAWSFVNDLISRVREKAKADVVLLENEKKSESKGGAAKLEPWDIAYYKTQIQKRQYNVNNEELRAYFPMEGCLKGMFDIYQKLLGMQFKKVQNPSVWSPEVEMYEVYEGTKLKGKFYMDLFPRPNKETWFYGVNIVSGKGNEFPVAMLLGNFTRPTKTSPSLLSQKELKTLFHEFGHIVNMMSYHGEFSSQQESKADFTESMSQLFENWIADYNMVSTFAKHYKTGKPLPKETFDNMQKAKKVASGIGTIQSLQRCVYDLNLYDKYNPEKPLSTDQLWKDIDKQLGVMDFYVPGTHYQANWIHINTHPVYYYGYLWSEVYALDMFTQFEKNGLTDTKTGMRYRELILANGTQRDIVKAVEEFLGRPSDNKAYIKSLDL
ncbi:M3 family metallopeptidase [Flavobacterium wongokense]|uniref:M3 family metallopeptidase n=1 Tax=Flavobacterium wongokense TaxID=2910674 RepID=UPI001F3BD84B|nr:M3 family metallopeptidase [Flavobacterium sp. WG47]MCF6132511.1 Zn-dependent oligopeptidase [Flavobacterium sp. WG47]